MLMKMTCIIVALNTEAFFSNSFLGDKQIISEYLESRG